MTTREELSNLAIAPGWRERYALFAALRAGDPLPSGVAWALTDLLTQLAVTVYEAETGQFQDASGATLRGWLDVLGRAQHKLMNEWTDRAET